MFVWVSCSCMRACDTEFVVLSSTTWRTVICGCIPATRIGTYRWASTCDLKGANASGRLRRQRGGLSGAGSITLPVIRARPHPQAYEKGVLHTSVRLASCWGFSAHRVTASQNVCSSTRGHLCLAVCTRPRRRRSGGLLRASGIRFPSAAGAVESCIATCVCSISSRRLSGGLGACRMHACIASPPERWTHEACV